MWTQNLSIFFDEIKSINYTIKIGYSYSLKLALYISTLFFMLVFLLKTYLYPLGFILLDGSTKFQTWLEHEVHCFKSFLGINIIYYFQVMLINYEQHVIYSFHERYLSHWCMTCPTKFIEILYFLMFKLNIQCFSLMRIYFIWM